MTPEQKASKQEYDRVRYSRLKQERNARKPLDPIEELTPEEIAYIAGLIDGEGSIYVAAVGPCRNKTVYPIIAIAMTHRPVMDWLATRLQSGKVQLHNQTNLRNHPYMKPQYRVQLFGKRAQLLCQKMLPYLRVKNEQARIITEFPCDYRVGPGMKIERTEINEIRFRLRDEVNGLNHVNCRNPVPVEKRKSFLRNE